MTLKEQVYARALELAGDVNPRQARVLEALCGASTSSLSARLRDGLTGDDCKSDFVTAAGMMALAALTDVAGDGPVEQITAGDFTVKKGAAPQGAASGALLKQAEQLMAPYLKDRFAFLGV